jgi:hypothetical protein
MNDAEQRLSRELAEALQTALANAVTDARKKRETEHFYAYILYTLPLYQYAVLLFNTEEGLVRIAENEKLRDELRWSPPDWECGQETEPLFDRVNGILDSLVRLQGYDEAECNMRRKIFLDVLKSLDAQGVFGTGPSRESVVVNIMWGDQDVRAYVESARELNPRAGYIHYARCSLPSLYAWEKEIEESRSMYKEEGLARIRRTIVQVETDLNAPPPRATKSGGRGCSPSSGT